MYTSVFERLKSLMCIAFTSVSTHVSPEKERNPEESDRNDEEKFDIELVCILLNFLIS